MKNMIALMLIALFGISTAAVAQDKPAGGDEKKVHQEWLSLLNQADKNKDGKISKDEYLAVMKDKKAGEAKFAALDSDGDGFISHEEFMHSLNSSMDMPMKSSMPDESKDMK